MREIHKKEHNMKLHLEKQVQMKVSRIISLVLHSLWKGLQQLK